MKIFTYMFGNTPFFFNEVIKLSQKKGDNIEWGVVYPRRNWKHTSINLVKKENFFYLYQNFENKYKNIDIYNFNYKSNFDSIYKIIESSKFYYKNRSSEVQIRSALTTYTLYKEFLLKNRPDAILFPDLEVVDGIILLNVCKELGIKILYAVHTRNLGKSFFAKDYYETLPEYFGNYNQDDLAFSKKFVSEFIHKEVSSWNVYLEKSEHIKINIPNIFYRYTKSIYSDIRYESQHIEKTDFLLRIKMNLSPIVEKYRKVLFDMYKINYFHIQTNSDYIPKNYIIFPLQVTPESSINTLEQFFIEQERVIDLVRLNMPNSYFLLLKEHPAMMGKRETSFYKRLRKKAGILLVSPKLDTKKFVQDSKLVITVTGTIGLESYLNDKPVLMFGPSFFSHLVDAFDSYKQLKKQIFELINKKEFDSIEEKIVNVAKIYNVTYNFIVHEPLHFPKVMETKNIENYLEAVKDHLNRIKGIN